MFPPMQFLMFTTTIECFMAASTALVCLNMAKGTNKLIGIDVTHDLAQLALISQIRALRWCIGHSLSQKACLVFNLNIQDTFLKKTLAPVCPLKIHF